MSSLAAWPANKNVIRKSRYSCLIIDWYSPSPTRCWFYVVKRKKQKSRIAINTRNDVSRLVRIWTQRGIAWTRRRVVRASDKTRFVAFAGNGSAETVRCTARQACAHQIDSSDAQTAAVQPKLADNLPVCSILRPPFGLNARPLWTFSNGVKLKYAKNCDLDVGSSILQRHLNNTLFANKSLPIHNTYRVSRRHFPIVRKS